MNSEEQYKNIEYKIIEAANSNQNAFTEGAWKKMELLLDKKDKKRRPFFWVWSLLLCSLSIGGYFIYQNNFTNKNTFTSSITLITKDENKNQSAISTINKTPNTEDLHSQQKHIISKNEEIENTSTATINKLDKTVSNQQNTAISQKYNQTIKQKNNNDVEELETAKKIKYNQKAKVKIKVTSPNSFIDTQEDGEDTQNESVYKNDADTTAKNTIAAEQNSPTKKNNPWRNDEVKKDSATKKQLSTNEEKKKSKKKFYSAIYFVASFGAEGNTTKFLSFKNTTITPRFGVGIGYQINNKLSIQTGFFASAKKYIAQANDYTIKAGSYLSTVKLISVNANCMVYEVPLSVQYNFVQKENFHLYSTVGLSTYFMKKEKYVYTIDNYGYPYTTKEFLYTGNQHLLAAFNFSFGVEKKIKDNLFIQVAPNFIIPLGGVGEGSIKLFTTSLNVGIKYFPFKKIK